MDNLLRREIDRVVDSLADLDKADTVLDDLLYYVDTLEEELEELRDTVKDLEWDIGELKYEIDVLGR